jgi:hypothetical protein
MMAEGHVCHPRWLPKLMVDNGGRSSPDAAWFPPLLLTIARQGKAKLFKFRHPWQGVRVLLQSGMAWAACGRRARFGSGRMPERIILGMMPCPRSVPPPRFVDNELPGSYVI